MTNQISRFSMNGENIATTLGPTVTRLHYCKEIMRASVGFPFLLQG